MVVKNGEEILNDGDAVKTGDVIVSGKVATYKEGYPEEYIYVHSMADIMAYTTHSKTATISCIMNRECRPAKIDIWFRLRFSEKCFHCLWAE